ncbi:unnamed protein product [Symbiodinium sp. CCMP2592]|nr:unnamed protein product [Symbiodinium sp. CCMP2592]
MRRVGRVGLRDGDRTRRRQREDHDTAKPTLLEVARSGQLQHSSNSESERAMRRRKLKGRPVDFPPGSIGSIGSIMLAARGSTTRCNFGLIRAKRPIPSARAP